MTAVHGRETIYRGITMRSRLEADVAQNLDNNSIDWSYEPKCFANENGQYLPDFKIVSSRLATYWEIKPSNFPLVDIPALAHRMEVIWDSEPGVRLGIRLWEYGGSSARNEAILAWPSHGYNVEPRTWYYFIRQNVCFPLDQVLHVDGLQ
jgi:hypothetical protein